MTPYIISILSAALVLLIAAFISNSIKYEGGSHPKDPGKRKLVFWVTMIAAPILTFVLGVFLFAPDETNDPIAHDEFMQALPIAAGLSLVIYILIGFVIAKAMKNSKLGHWF